MVVDMLAEISNSTSKGGQRSMSSQSDALVGGMVKDGKRVRSGTSVPLWV